MAGCQASTEAKNEVLAAEAAKIRKKIQKQWGIQAAATTQKIQAVNSKLQDQIRDIDHSIATAEKVVKAVGIVDDLVDLAKKVAAAIA